MELKKIKLNGFREVLPIIQGGMAIRISTGKLAGAVARENCIGVIAGSGMENDELREEIAIARKIANGKGLIGVNIMVAAHEFLELVNVCLEENVDIIFAGAGFSKDVFRIVKESKANTLFVPIVSSAKAAVLSVKLGADFLVVEGGNAGGHLGTDRPLLDVLPEVVDAISGQVKIFGAGGILDGSDIKKVLEVGADGVQLATRFVMSEECNADIRFKQWYLDHAQEGTHVFMSSVGYPGRAVMTPFLQKIENNEIGKFPCKHLCLKSCTRRFCIIEALIRAQKGDVENGIVFAGLRYGEIKDILPVKQIINNLLKEIKEI